MTVWNESEHPRDEKGKFTDKGGAIPQKNSYNDKMQHRADILYGSDEDYIKKYYGNAKETDILKRYQDKELNNLEQRLKNTSKKIEEIKSNNAKFSNSEIEKARKFIQGSEGCELKSYQDIAGVWTIGYGHTGKVDGKLINVNTVITKEKAEELYRKDFEAHIAPLKNVEVPLTSNQKIALASFIYNFGPKAFLDSELYKKLNAGDYEGAAAKFDEWIKAKNPKTGRKEVSEGLVNRRKKEKELFLTPDKE